MSQLKIRGNELLIDPVDYLPARRLNRRVELRESSRVMKFHLDLSSQVLKDQRALLRLVVYSIDLLDDGEELLGSVEVGEADEVDLEEGVASWVIIGNEYRISS